MPWMVSHLCQDQRCGKPTFTCNGSCVSNNRKRTFNESYGTSRQAKRHHRAYHSSENHVLPTVEEQDHQESFDSGSEEINSTWPSDEPTISGSVLDLPIQEDSFSYSNAVSFDGDEIMDLEDPDLVYIRDQDDDMADWPNFNKSSSVSEDFCSQIVSGDAWSAASLLVKRAAYQTRDVPSQILPIPNVMLFLYLARLVMSSGLTQRLFLSKFLQILYPMVGSSQKNWAPLPCTVSGFRSCFSNVSNSNSLVSILPIPIPETLPDGHGYTPLRNILEHAFMMEKFDAAATKDPKWKSLASSKKFQGFLQDLTDKGVSDPSSGLRQLAVGLLIWTDGWDPSTGCKSNRSPMHTGTISLLIVDVATEAVVGVCTYPNMGGPGKINHEPAFCRLKEDIAAFESDGSDRRFSSRLYSSLVEVHTRIMFVVQDQPERRAASGLLGGGSKMHPMFGMSCEFQNLRLPFEACDDCVSLLDAYLAAGDWSRPPMEVRCEYCLGWSLNRLTCSSYDVPYVLPGKPPDIDDQREVAIPPGIELFRGPGRLVSKLLKASWEHCIDEFVNQARWVEADVKLYFGILCINEATIGAFIDTCRRQIYLRQMEDNQDSFSADQIAQFEDDKALDPESYELPPPPAMWSIGDIEDKTEGVMHLSMGIQKAVFKFIILWATGHNLGASLQRRLAENLGAIQNLKVAYCPCRPYKDEKFGGFTAEGYRAMTMTSLYIYRSLLEIALQPKPPRDINPKPQKDWTRQDNLNWMYVRGIEYSPQIHLPEAREQVRRALMMNPVPKPIKTLPDPVTTEEIRDLVWRMYNMFRAIFCTDLVGEEAMHRATASVMRFLSLMEVLDYKLSPKRTKPIWIAKFNFLGLLRVCESFVQFGHVRNLYEGGEIGEAIVKHLRPFVAKGVHGKWATNLLLSHYRNSTLDHLIDALEENSARKKGCLLGEKVESSKFRRYSTAAEVMDEMEKGRPLPVLLYGSEAEWKAGAIVIYKKNWYFKEIVFESDGDCVVDPYGLTYHRVHSPDLEYNFGAGDIEMEHVLGDESLPFWGYALLFADLIEDTEIFRYAIVRNGWQYLNVEYVWSEHD